MQNYSYALYPDELYHYGVKDMHWGVRNYQNKDGSLTTLGRIHYGIEGMYNGPKMEHLKSQVARGWATANDPEFLGRKMADVKASLGRASVIAKDPDFWKQDVGNVRDYIKNYFGDVNKSPNADPRYVDISQTGSFNVDYGGVKGKKWKTDDIYTLDSGVHKSGQLSLTGNTLLSVYESRETGKNIKMSDLAKATFSDVTSDEFKKNNDISNVVYRQRTFEAQMPYQISLSSSLDPSGHSLIDTGYRKVEYDIPTNIDMRAIYDKHNKQVARGQKAIIRLGDDIDYNQILMDDIAYAEKRKEKKASYVPDYEKQISNILRNYYTN